MLVIISDLHLTDESTANNVAPEALKLLEKEIITNAVENDATEIHLVLLGDIFDLVRTDYWCTVPERERPWFWKNDDYNDATAINNSTKVEDHLKAITQKIKKSKASKTLVRIINGLSAKATARYGSNIKTRVSYVIGNHDRFLVNYDSLQSLIRNEFNSVRRFEFRHAVCAPEYGVLARHGHEWDEDCHGWEFYNDKLNTGPSVGRFDQRAYKAMAIGELITAEFLSGMLYNIARRLNRDDPSDKQFMYHLKDINNLRPSSAAFQWLQWSIRGQGYERYRTLVEDGVKTALDSLLKSNFAELWSGMSWGIPKVSRTRITDLKLARAATNVLGAEIATKLSPSSSEEEDLLEGAKESVFYRKDPELKPDIQYIVYGHTHGARHNYFEATPQGTVRMYINSGTFLPLIEKDATGKGFATSHQMTMLFFYNKSEDSEDRADNGPTVDIWNGVKRKQYTDKS